jgi:hypothetical protein
MRPLFDKSAKQIWTHAVRPKGVGRFRFRLSMTNCQTPGSVRLRAGFLDVPSWQLVLKAEP